MSKIEELPPSDTDDHSYSSKPGDVFLAFVDAPVKETDDILIEDSFIAVSYTHLDVYKRQV